MNVIVDGLSRQSILDEEHLRLLSIGYRVSAGVSLFTSLIGLMYMLMGLLFGTVGARGGAGAPPVDMGLFFGIMGFAVFVLCVAFGLLQWRTATCLRHRRSPMFCMVIAAINCLGMPWGTVLGVFTFIVLGRESVESSFKGAASVQPGPAQ